jgi:hypothetical protein
MSHDWSDPWHTLTVTVTHWHALVGCEGHATPDASTEPEIETDLVHPDTCPDPSRDCCCKGAPAPTEPRQMIATLGPGPPVWREADPWQPCPPCGEGRHTECFAIPPWRCGTEEDVSEYYDVNDLPTVSGTYRVRSSGDFDYWGEYDQSIECEPIPAAETTP